MVHLSRSGRWPFPTQQSIEYLGQYLDEPIMQKMHRSHACATTRNNWPYLLQLQLLCKRKCTKYSYSANYFYLFNNKQKTRNRKLSFWIYSWNENLRVFWPKKLSTRPTTAMTAATTTTQPQQQQPPHHNGNNNNPPPPPQQQPTPHNNNNPTTTATINNNAMLTMPLWQQQQQCGNSNNNNANVPQQKQQCGKKQQWCCSNTQQQQEGRHWNNNHATANFGGNQNTAVAIKRMS